LPSLETAARSLKVVPINAPVHSDAGIEAAIVALGGEPGGGLVFLPDIFTMAHRAPIISAAARNDIPAVYRLPSPVSTYMPSFEAAARSLKVVPIIAPVHSDAEIETAIIALGREPGGGLVVMPDTFMYVHRAPIILAAARNNVPAVYQASEIVRDGGLLSYGPDPVDTPRRAATYVNRILRGAKPGDLPVQFPTKFEMAVNLKTAKALGLALPPSILVRADEVIE
jgi:hypothetical protein